MRWPRPTRPTPIGVDVGGRVISAAQLRRAGPQWVLGAATSIQRLGQDRPLEAEETMRLADVLERRGFQGRDVVAALPSERLMTAMLEVPPAGSGAPIAHICRAELAAAHKVDPGSIELGFWTLPDGPRRRTGSTVLTVGCRREEAETMLGAFEAAGMVVRGLDVQAWALWRACAPLLAPVERFAALVNLDWTAASVVVVSPEAVVYERALVESGLSHLYAALVNELGLDVDVVDYVLREAGLTAEVPANRIPGELAAAVRERIEVFLNDLAAELRMSLGYIEQEYGGDGVGRMLVLGESATVPGLVDHLAQACGVETDVPVPSQLAQVGSRCDAEPDSPVLATAIGLAQYPVEAAA